VDIVSTSTFRKSKNLLIKRPENGYSTCCKDICDALNNLTFDDIYQLHHLIKQSGEIRVIKVRIKNSQLNLSSSAGFRLIIVCNKKHDHVALLKIYPKKGKYGQSDLRPFESQELFKTYASELSSGVLIKHDIRNNLVERG
jgi:hypothetical protein